jgi:hypothetical protein
MAVGSLYFRSFGEKYLTTAKLSGRLICDNSCALRSKRIECQPLRNPAMAFAVTGEKVCRRSGTARFQRAPTGDAAKVKEAPRKPKLSGVSPQ